ncbi:PUA-like domain-containing protein [Desarmillaria tabescens]|uniref:PUA-like domain-containing protein n=1 Tax=Armillaria tabescens TaxID=1929756 RepID=A0AA39T7L5_ARMTA|nr:PUA-like domain-containing protein [Desarmillaria tabescens]KAK0470051.1 PUA-like domain-containing protein [Desarmillaria tabescens]
MYTDESFRIKPMRKYGKPEWRIVKDYRNLDVVKPKEREGCRTPVVNPGTLGEIDGQPVGTRYVDRTLLLEAGMHGGIRRGIYSFKGSARSVVLSDGYEEFNKDKGNRIRLCGEGGRSKDGKMQVKDQEYTHGNRALQNTMQSGQPVRVIRGYKLDSKYAPSNGFRYDGLYRVTGCYEKRDENGYRVILFKLERLPGQLPIGTPGKFWVYPNSNAPAKTTEPSEPKKTESTSLFPPRPKLPSFYKSSTSSHTLPSNWQQIAVNQSYPTRLYSDSGAPMLPVPAVKVMHQKENYCDDTLQYPIKSESPSSVPLLQYPECDIKDIGPSRTQESTATLTSPISTPTPRTLAKKPSPLPRIRVKAESPPLASVRKRSGSTLGDPLPRKRQKLSNTPLVKAESPPPFCERLGGGLSERGPRKRKYSDMEDCV